MYVLQYRKKYYFEHIDTFDSMQFSNQCLALIAINLRLFLKNRDSYNEKLNMIRHLLANKQIVTYIKDSHIVFNISYRDWIYISALKTNSPTIIFVILSLINFLSSAWQKIKLRIKQR